MGEPLLLTWIILSSRAAALFGAAFTLLEPIRYLQRRTYFFHRCLGDGPTFARAFH
jgi:hypothetical protein